jgi:hypothetical protein
MRYFEPEKMGKSCIAEHSEKYDLLPWGILPWLHCHAEQTMYIAHRPEISQWLVKPHIP